AIGERGIVGVAAPRRDRIRPRAKRTVAHLDIAAPRVELWKGDMGERGLVAWTDRALPVSAGFSRVEAARRVPALGRARQSPGRGRVRGAGSERQGGEEQATAQHAGHIIARLQRACPGRLSPTYAVGEARRSLLRTLMNPRRSLVARVVRHR